MIEPSVCGGDAVLCQITLTTCTEMSYKGITTFAYEVITLKQIKGFE